jgi:polynucleotide 5'-kinase involved in rRNA processing
MTFTIQGGGEVGDIVRLHDEQRSESREQRAKSRERTAEGRQRASQLQRSEIRAQRAQCSGYPKIEETVVFNAEGVR